MGSVIGDEIKYGDDIATSLVNLSKNYNIGELEIIENSLPQSITFSIYGAQSSQDIDPPKDKTHIPSGICSFEAGLFAGYVEKCSGKHCFSQQLESKVGGDPKDKFMLVFSSSD